MRTNESAAAGSEGFSLIEVTIAMAIAAVALVTLIGMVPQGMQTMVEAGDEAIMGRIHQQLLNELQMSDFAAVEDFDAKEFFFDGQGEELGDTLGGGSSGAKGSLEHIYSARVTIPRAPGGRLPPSVGGGSFDGMSFDQNTRNESIRVAVIEVAAVSGLGSSFDWDDPRFFRLIRAYQTNVVEMGRDFGP